MPETRAGNTNLLMAVSCTKKTSRCHNLNLLFYLSFFSDNSEKKESVFSVKKILELLKIPTVFFLITIKIITGIPFGIFQSMFSLVSMEYFKLEPQQNGFVMSYVGGLSIVSYL